MKAHLLLGIALLVSPDIAGAQEHARPAPGGRPGVAKPMPDRPTRPNRPGGMRPPNPGGPAIQPPRPDRPRPPVRPGPGAGQHPRPPHRPGFRPPNFRPIHRPGWRYPPGYAYRRWTIGLLLPHLFLSSNYYFDDYANYGFGPPPYGCRWVRYGPDLLLVEKRSGRIRDVIYNAFD